MRTYEVHRETRHEQLTAVADKTLAVAEIGPWLAHTYSVIEGVLAGQGMAPAGPPFARYHQLSDDKFLVEAGFPVSATITPMAAVRASKLPGGTAATVVHKGRYEEMAPAYDALASWISGQGGTPLGDAWEFYLDEPDRDPATWRTVITQPYQEHVVKVTAAPGPADPPRS